MGLINTKYRWLLAAVLMVVVVLTVLLNLRQTTPDYITECLQDTETLTRLKDFEEESVKEVYLIADKAGQPTELLQIVETMGYNAPIKLRVQLDIKKEKLSNLTILSHEESATYGAYAAEEWFLARFADRDTAIDLCLTKIAAKRAAEIVAVTGATITSQAIVDGVNRAFSTYRKYQEGN